MFTVLQERLNGDKMLHTACNVQFIPPTEANGNAGGVHMLASPQEAGPGISVDHLVDGKVYVRNDKGATVAIYDRDVPRHAPPRYDAKTD